MSAIHKLKPLSVDDYLALEEASEIRHELIDGYLVAMVGTTQRHNLIAGNLLAALHSHLRGSPCRVFIADLKVRIDNNFYYPDLVVSCQPGELTGKLVPEPLLVIEVLSSSTEARDRYEKRIAYQRLASLREYVLVAQDEPRVEVFRRLPDGWEVESYQGKEWVRFASLELELEMEVFYEGIFENRLC